MVESPVGRPEPKHLHVALVGGLELVHQVVEDRLVLAAPGRVAHVPLQAALRLVIVLHLLAAPRLVHAADAVRLTVVEPGHHHGPRRRVGHEIVVAVVHGSDLEHVVAHRGDEAAFVGRVDAAVGGVADLADAGATGDAQVEVVGLLVGEDLVEHDRGVPLHHLHALAVQLDDVVDGVGIELEELVHRVAERLDALGGEAKGVELAQEDGATPHLDELIDDVAPARQARAGDRRQRLDAVLVGVQSHAGVALVDLLHPAEHHLVAVAAAVDADLVVQVGGPVEAGADLHLAVEQEFELLVVHQRQVGHQRERQHLARRDVLLPGVFDDVAQHVPVRRRLAALKLDGDPPSSGLEGQVDGAFRRLHRHVGVGALHADDRAVAVLAPVVAAMGQHEGVQGRTVEEVLLLAPPALDLRRQVDVVRRRSWRAPASRRAARRAAGALR